MTRNDNPGEFSYVMALPYAEDAARTARTAVAELLGGNVAVSSIAIAVILTSELVTNAVLHATPPAQLSVHITEAVLRVEVYDSDPTPPTPRNAEVTDANGRGLAIIDALASKWGTERRDDGKAVWFELALNSDTAAHSN